MAAAQPVPTRPTPSCHLEPLESRHLFSTLALDPTFHSGTVVTRISGHEDDLQAERGVVLKSGKLLVAASTDTNDDPYRLIFLLYNRDGTLSKSFDGDGKLTLTSAESGSSSSVEKLVELTDGNILIVSSSAIRKISADGRFDRTFGDNGVLTIDGILASSDVAAAKHGGFRVLSESTSNYHVVATTYTSAGKAVAAAELNAVGQASFNADGNITVIDYIYETSLRFGIKRFDADLKPLTTFGKNGYVNIRPAYERFIKTNGKFHTTFPKNGDLPFPYFTLFSVGADGTMVVRTLVQGITGKLPSLVDFNLSLTSYEFRYTRAWMAISGDGRTISVRGDATSGRGAFDLNFLPAESDVMASYFPTTGGQFDTRVGAGSAFFTGGAIAPDGGIYAFGLPGRRDAGGHYGIFVARFLPPTGLIAGYAFNDANGNGLRDGGERLSARQTIFLDADNDGVLDDDEVYAVTDTRGRYTFPAVAAGTWHVRAVVGADTRLTTAASGNVVITGGGDRHAVNVGTTAGRTA